MSKVTPVEEPELSVNENPHIHIHLHSVGEIIPKTSNQIFFENMPHRFNYVEPDDQQVDSSSKGVLAEIRKMQQSINNFVEPLEKDKKKERIKDILNKTFTLIVTIMTLAAAIIPIMMLTGSTTTEDKMSSTTNVPNTPITTLNPITIKSPTTTTKTTIIISSTPTTTPTTISIPTMTITPTNTAATSTTTTTTTTMTTTITTITTTTTTTTTTMSSSLTSTTTITTTTTNTTSVMRYIVATGRPYDLGKKTEVVDLSDPSKSCLLEDIPYRYRSAGGLLGTTPVICGGHDGGNFLNECLFYGTNHVITMNSKRSNPKSVALSDDRIWILGGSKIGGSLNSTEFVSDDGAVNGPTLPEAVFGHCIVKLMELIYLIGGTTPSSDPTKNVWVANPSNGYDFVQGPSMITSRRHHSCGTMSIGSKSIIVSAGGVGNNYFSSVEILDPLSNQWVEGPGLPMAILNGAMATSPDGNGVILVGGYVSGTNLDSILELKADGQGWVREWTTLSTKLQYERWGHIVFPVLVNKDICGLDGIVPDE